MIDKIETSDSDFMIRVISMPHANERRETFAKFAEDSAVPWSFVDAHTAPASFLINDPDQQRLAMSRTLLPAEIGCYSSHASVWRNFLASSARVLIVFEDDVVVDWQFVELLLRHDFEAMAIHYLKLFDKVPVRRKVIRSSFINRYYHLVQNLNAPFGAQAYVLTRTGAARMFDNAVTIRRPIDSELDRFWVHKLPSLSVVPSPVFERCSVSTIGEARFEKGALQKGVRVRRLIELYQRFTFAYFAPASFTTLRAARRILEKTMETGRGEE